MGRWSAAHRKTAIFGFESFGPGNTSCNGTGQGIGGALHFYDVTDPVRRREEWQWLLAWTAPPHEPQP